MLMEKPPGHTDLSRRHWKIRSGPTVRMDGPHSKAVDLRRQWIQLIGSG